MHRFSVASVVVGLLSSLALARAQEPTSGPTTAPSTQATSKVPAPAGWKLVWNDEFDGGTLDTTKWAYEKGNSFQVGALTISGWGNDELEFYTERPANVFIVDGMLHLRALKEAARTTRYTSGRIKTKNLFSKAYGRFEYRAKLPLGKGLWSAIWLLPQEQKYGGWASSGEIDVMEARGQESDKVLGTLHYGSKWPANTRTGKDYILPDHGTIADFHVYAMEWEPGEFRWYVDDHLYETQNFWWSSSKTSGLGGATPTQESDLNPWPAPFDRPFYLILNLAVGGKFLGNPDATTKFPSEMVIDYVRVYDRDDSTATAKIKPRGEGTLPFKTRK